MAVINCKLGHPDTGFGIVTVYVEHRRADGLRHVGGVLAGPRILRRGGESDLIVDDHVHGTAGAVAAQLRQVERLGHHALPGEGGVPVQRDGQHGETLWSLVEHVLLGPGDAFEHWVHGLQVRWIRNQRHLRLAVSEHPVVLALSAQVVLDIAVALQITGMLVIRKILRIKI